MSVQGYIQLKGDFGNPSGSGLSKLLLPNLPDEAHATLETRMTAYHTALATAQLTAANKAEAGVTYGDGASTAPPGSNVNVDRKLVVTWNRESDATVRKHTISGVPTSSTGISLEDAGERLNATGKAALATALNAMYDITDAVVVTGKVIQKA